ncbi:MAG: TetR/AcrR family transcriptional regulator [Magnetococcales bacterium]|nr:TetR/AcrR family transcriptional regulator [Magnetococcales bacterium]
MSELSPVAARRAEMLQVARRVFLERGMGASMEQLACEMGMARQTLYNHFESKDRLYAEMIRATAESFLFSLRGDDTDFREYLIQFGVSIRHILLSDEGLGLFRLMIGETARRPELAEIVFHSGPGNTLNQLTRVMTSAMERGVIRAEDPAFAAEMLLSMLLGVEQILRLLGRPARPPEAERVRVAAIVERFLCAFVPDASGNLSDKESS